MSVFVKDNVTGEVTSREVVDAREIIKMREKDGSARYSLVPAAPPIPTVEDEFSREPVGSNAPGTKMPEDETSRLRNPVSEQPRMSPLPKGVNPTNPGATGAAFDRDVERDLLESQTVAELKETARNEGLDLGGATSKADIVNKMLTAHASKAKEISQQ